MASGAEREGYQGLANVANSIRRSMALYAAVSLTEPGTAREEVEEEAEHWARWIGGQAAQVDQERQQTGGQPLGMPWPPVD